MPRRSAAPTADVPYLHVKQPARHMTMILLRHVAA